MFFNQGRVLLVIFLLFCHIAYSGTLGPECNQRVTIPCSNNALNLGGQALYLRPNYPGFALSQSIGTNNRLRSLQYWQWGFSINANYFFDTGNDLSINWYHWNNSSNKNFKGVFDTLSANTFLNPTVYLQPKWDAINLEFGQLINLGRRITARFYAGGQYVNLKTTFGINGSNNILADVINTNKNKSYEGGGPRIGIDLSSQLINLKIYSKTALGILVGNSKFNNFVNYISYPVVNSSAAVTTIVPEIEEKLGLQYNFFLARGILKFDLGWMWVNYFKPFENAIYNPPVYISATTAENFGLQGAFLGVSLLWQ